jgi:hypothetical protein
MGGCGSIFELEYRVSSTKPFYSDDSKRVVARGRSLWIYAASHSVYYDVSLWCLDTVYFNATRVEARNVIPASVLTKKDKSYADGDQQDPHPPLEADSFMQKDDSSKGSGDIA